MLPGSSTAQKKPTVPQKADFGEATLAALINRMPRLRRKPSVRLLDAIRGSAWTFGGYGASQLLRFAVTLVLARRLLGPQAFGLVALTNVFLGGLELLSDFGIATDVVQHRRGDEPDFIDTAYSLQLIRGAVLFFVALGLTPLFASFYGQPAVQSLAVVGAISVALRGLASSSIWSMTRHLKLGRLTVLNISTDAIGFVVSVFWALVSPTAWALVVGKIASTLAYTLGSHLMAERPFRLKWEHTALRDLLGFGTGMLLSSATYFLGGEAERLVIGKFITVADLGCFSIALTIASAPSMALQKVAGQVFLPMIAQSRRHGADRLARHYLHARMAFGILALGLGGLLIGYGPKIVQLLLPSKYAMTGWMLQWLGFRAALEVFSTPGSNVILACGDSRYSAIANISRLILMTTGVWFAFAHSGIHQAIAVLALVPALTYLMLLPGFVRHLRGALWAELGTYMLFCTALVGFAYIPWPFAQ